MSYEPTNWQTGDIVTSQKLNKLESGVEGINMSYEPTTWQTGDVVTSTKLNKLEQGVAAGGGGSSDYTTATVTFINTNEDQNPYSLLVTEVANGSLSLTMLEVASERQITIPLYNGEFYLSLYALQTDTFDPSTQLIGTGGVDVDYDNGWMKITGNGTFTATGRNVT